MRANNKYSDVKFEIIVPQALIKLSKLNKPIYIVGGYIRNSFLSLNNELNNVVNYNTDIDICGECLANDLILPNNAICQIVNKKLGTAIINIDNEQYEYTPFRTENYLNGGMHRPDSVEFVTDIIKDCFRRDFSCNAIYYCINSNKIVDYTGGVLDIKNKTLKQVNDDVFKQDGLRLLRLARLAGELGFKIDNDTLIQAIKHNDNIKDISIERIKAELDKIIIADTKYNRMHGHVDALKNIKKIGVWDCVFLGWQSDARGVLKERLLNELASDIYDLAIKLVADCPKKLRLLALLCTQANPDKILQQLKASNKEIKRARIVATNCWYGFNADWLCTNINHKNISKDNNEDNNEYTSKDININKEINKDINQDNNISVEDIRLFIAYNQEYIVDILELQRHIAHVLFDDRIIQFNQLLSDVYQLMLQDNTPLKLSDLKINGIDCINQGINKTMIATTLNRLWIQCVINPSKNNREWLLSML